MRKFLAGSVALGILAGASRADDVIWRAAGNRNQLSAPATAPVVSPPQPVVNAPRPMPVRQVAAPASAGEVTWVRARGQSADDQVLPQPTPRPLGIGPVPLSQVIESPPSDVNSVPMPPMPGPAGVESFVGPCDGVYQSELAAQQGRAPRVEVSAEYLYWWIRGGQTPPLLTTSPPNGVNGIPGALPGSVVLLGGDALEDTQRNGFRIGAVYWIDCCASYGFDGRIFFTGEQTRSYAINSRLPNGQDLELFRPFFAPNVFAAGQLVLPGPFSERVTGPGVSTGSFSAENRSQFWGAEANYRDNLWCLPGCSSLVRVDLLAGFRYLNLNESLNIVENYTLLNPDAVGNPAGTRVVILDQFDTENNFYGGQLGTNVQYRRNRWTFDLRSSVALGSTTQRLSIAGSQVRTPPGGVPQVFVGGLLAENSNIGTRERSVFSVVPEIGFNIGYQLTDHLRTFGGYNFLYWSNVLRPGDQIDPVIDVTRIPAFVPPPLQGQIPAVFPPRPAPLFAESDFWAQGLNVGLEYRW